MKIMEFMNIVEDPKHEDLDVGMLFMEGSSMIAQKSNKKIGDWASYYKVTGKQGKLISYEPVSEKLEEN